MTVKLWRNLDISASARTSADTEPIITYRGHTAPVTSLAVSTRTGLVYSGSLDSDIRIWRLPDPSFDTYDSFDPTTRVGSISASGDAVWGLQLFENEEGEERMAAISADGYVRVWDTEKRECVKSWDYEGVEAKESSFKRKRIVPTAITLVKSSPTGKGQQLAVAYFDSIVKLFDAETGEERLKLKSSESYGESPPFLRRVRAFADRFLLVDGTPQTQINQITSHPSKRLLATAHEDKFIRLFDLETGDCLHSSLASVGHDTSLRFWNLDLVCTQEIASHRPKATEGILDITAHEQEMVVVSAGADGTVRLWARE
ncbi:WD40-repeat-containing domain protein [Leucosporidium creatinivorum]|uniref:WD40-repeat-containing domain protein n=1 Tax=Leucosporidium creatinivorum TaxID=106004 RepID=A0A1Y2E5F4_9BASI|nr:WD40-repeat-containing domain protein [Leucosporidium creatinivorum]